MKIYTVPRGAGSLLNIKYDPKPNRTVLNLALSEAAASSESYSCSSRRWSTGRPLELAGAPGGPAGSYEYAADLLAWSVA